MGRRDVVLGMPVRSAIGTVVAGNVIQAATHALGLAAAWPSRKADRIWRR